MLKIDLVPARFVKPANRLLGIADSINAGVSAEVAGRVQGDLDAAQASFTRGIEAALKASGKMGLSPYAKALPSKHKDTKYIVMRKAGDHWGYRA
jgi:hypothetical protein